MKSIRFKLIPISLALVFIVMVTSGTMMLTYLRVEEHDRVHDNLRATAAMIANEVFLVTEPEQLPLLGGDFLQASAIKSYILNELGVVIWASDQTEGINHFSNTAVLAALTGQARFASGTEADANGQTPGWLKYAIPVSRTNPDGSQQPFVIYTRTLSGPIDERLTEISLVFLVTIFVALSLTCVLGFVFANALTKPIAMLTKGASEMAKGNFHQALPVHSRDEIGQLTESFNHMARELALSVNTIVDDRNKLQTILNNYSDGLLAYNSKGELIHSNRASAELLGVDHLDDLSFSQAMEVLGGGMVSPYEEGEVDTTLQLDGRVINAHFRAYRNFSGEVGGVVVVLADITKKAMLDELRKEFVANVSHEIRTPLTTIKGYTETLMEGAIEDRDVAMGFLRTIDAETDRMTLLAKDLLDLSSFDNRQMKLHFRGVNLIDILNQCVRQFEVPAQKKGQHMHFSADHLYNTPWIKADPDRVNQVFSNILGNAIKYSHHGASIFISIEQAPDCIVICFRDTGMGIPEEELPRIFERFYRVDKARSRTLGGTGLGLSIAKEIVEAHGGTISAESRPGVGTTMRVSFPLYEASASDAAPTKPAQL